MDVCGVEEVNVVFYVEWIGVGGCMWSGREECRLMINVDLYVE